jgi:hypothetical protein
LKAATLEKLQQATVSELTNGWTGDDRSGWRNEWMVRRSGQGEPSNKRRKAVSVEQLRGEFKVVLDGYKGLGGRLNQIEAKIDSHHVELRKYMMDGVKQVLGEMNARFTEVNARLDHLTVRFDAHEQAHAR